MGLSGSLQHGCGRGVAGPRAAPIHLSLHAFLRDTSAQVPCAKGGRPAMHVLFIHPNFPAQFGLIANYLTTQMGWPSTFLTSIDTTHLQLPFTHVNYKVRE